MSDHVMQRVMFRKEHDDALPVAEAVRRLLHHGARVLDEAPQSLLVEGESELFLGAGPTVPGWKAMPVRRYPVPDARVKIR